MANQMLEQLGLVNVELSVLLTNDEGIRKLNWRHRHKNRPTDVLSFPVASPLAFSSAPRPRLLGDIAISLDTAARQARQRRRELATELRFLLAHGLLHLLGYDHGEPQQKREMVAQTRRLVLAAPLPQP
jgi:probable rRNA maturation factor